MPVKTYDVLIVGSGHSGGMAANILTSKGISCLMLNAGPEADYEKDRALKHAYELPYRGFDKPGRLPHVFQANEFNANQWVDEKEVPWEKIVKGYEYEKGQFVIVDDKDFEKAMPEATQSIDIIEFVDLAEIDPMFFDKPYYLEPQKGGKKAYALLRETLKETGKVGVARVVIKTRQHLAAVKPKDDSLVLELMHFPDEVLEPAGLDLPREEKLGKKEMDMAKSLVETMSGEWDPSQFKDEYRDNRIFGRFSVKF